jgi:PIN like domain
LNVETLIGNFARYDEKDQDWLPVIGKRGWVVLTADYRMRYRERERDALMEHNVRMFILRAHHHQQRIRNFLDALPKVEQFLRSHDEGFMAKVYHEGRVEMWLQRHEWLRKVGLAPE